MIEGLKSYYNEEGLKGITGLRKDAPPVGPVGIAPKRKASPDEGNTGFPIVSDRHADEVVKASTVLGKNGYDKDTAEKRIANFFADAAYMIRKKPVDNSVMGLIGDMIGGYTHPEPGQTNSASPMRGANLVKSLIISGLKYLHGRLPGVNEITVIGICGNHPRTTKKAQFSNGFGMGYEHFPLQGHRTRPNAYGADKIQSHYPRKRICIYWRVRKENSIRAWTSIPHGWRYRGHLPVNDAPVRQNEPNDKD